MNKQVIPLGNNLIIKVVEVEEKTKGGIILTSSSKEQPVHGVVLARGEYAYHPNGDIKQHSIEVGDTVCFMKNAGTTVAEAPDGESWLAIAEDCIYYKVISNG